VRRLLLALAAFTLVLLPSTPAWAHNQLLGSTPTADATLTSAPRVVTLQFVERLNAKFTTIVVSDAARRRIAASAVTAGGATGSITLTGEMANGAYTVAYRTVSVDGHAVQGSYTFTLADPARPAAVTVSPGPSPTSAESRAPIMIGVGGGALLAVVTTGYFWRRRNFPAPANDR
jgi:copper resistance protein C